MQDVTVIDSGLGNIWSVLNALRFLGARPAVTSSPKEVAQGTRLILPGVGAFSAGMDALRDQGLEEPILEAVKSRQVPILGICLGMQLLAASGNEGGEADGLGLIEQRVEPFSENEVAGRKIPHVGIDAVEISDRQGLFDGLEPHASFYFTHAYRMLPCNNGREASCRYGVEFLAAFHYGNVCGTQFHPEKSQSNGLRLLKSFMEL